MAADPPDAGPALPIDPAKEDLPPYYFELYNLAVEMADRTSARRLTANTFFVTLNTGLAALLGAHAFQWYVAVAGVVLAVAWWALLKSYRDLNGAKYTVINAMEARLPVRIFSDEWSTLKPQQQPSSVSGGAVTAPGRGSMIKAALHQGTKGEWLTQYWELGTVERVIPWIFAAIYLIALLSRTAL